MTPTSTTPRGGGRGYLVYVLIEEQLMYQNILDSLESFQAPVKVVSDTEIMDSYVEAMETFESMKEDDHRIRYLSSAAREIENINSSLESFIGNGSGMTKETAFVTNSLMADIGARLNVKVSSPSLESYSFTGGRLQATKDSLEANEGLLSRIWKAISGFFKAIWEKMKKWGAAIKNFFTGAGKKAEDNAKKTNEKAEAAGAKSDGEPTPTDDGGVKSDSDAGDGGDVAKAATGELAKTAKIISTLFALPAAKIIYLKDGIKYARMPRLNSLATGTKNGTQYYSVDGIQKHLTNCLSVSASNLVSEKMLSTLYTMITDIGAGKVPNVTSGGGSDHMGNADTIKCNLTKVDVLTLGSNQAAGLGLDMGIRQATISKVDVKNKGTEVGPLSAADCVRLSSVIKSTADALAGTDGTSVSKVHDTLSRLIKKGEEVAHKLDGSYGDGPEDLKSAANAIKKINGLVRILITNLNVATMGAGRCTMLLLKDSNRAVDESLRLTFVGPQPKAA